MKCGMEKEKHQTNQHHNPTTNKKNNRTPTEHGKKKPNQRILLKISSIKKDELPLSESGGVEKKATRKVTTLKPVVGQSAMHRERELRIYRAPSLK